MYEPDWDSGTQEYSRAQAFSRRGPEYAHFTYSGRGWELPKSLMSAGELTFP